MAFFQSPDIITETHMYDNVYVRTGKLFGRFQSAVENDAKEKRMTLFTYPSQDDAEYFHDLSVDVAQSEHEEWVNEQSRSSDAQNVRAN